MAYAMSVKRLAFILEVFDSNWMGGVNYYTNLINGLSDLSDSSIDMVIFTSDKLDLYRLEEKLKVIRSTLFKRGSFLWCLRKILHKIIKKDLLLHLFLMNQRVDIVFNYQYVGYSIPTLSWIPDFQDKRIPEFFDSVEIAHREKFRRYLLRFGDAVLLSSYSAKKDMQLFYPNQNIDVYVYPFVSGVAENWRPCEKKYIQEKYNLPSRWFHLPNQFWKHKNHSVVVDALDLLGKKREEITIVSTGSNFDYRNPQHFSSITQRIKEYGLESSFFILGVIPYEDMLSIMYYSIAVINPSRFEGWSSSVEEAKSLGKELIISNIDTHLEQSPKRVKYFSCDDPITLSRLLLQSQQYFSEALEVVYSEKALLEQKEIRRKSAIAFLKIIFDVITKSSLITCR
jgi:glycosyltransferase involved in cell wall biosynthesis